MGLISRLLQKKPHPTREDSFFGQMRFRQDHWVASAPLENGERIEALLIGSSALQDFTAQRERFEELQHRLPELMEISRPMIEAVALQQYDARPATEYFNGLVLRHVMLPDPDDAGHRWDFTVSGRELQREAQEAEGGLGSEEMYCIDMQDWRPIGVELV